MTLDLLILVKFIAKESLMMKLKKLFLSFDHDYMIAELSLDRRVCVYWTG